MGRKEYIVEEVTKIMTNIENIRNIGIIAHVHHGKTTLTDSLLAKAGMIPRSSAGDLLYTNYEAVEKDRRMTVKSAYISLGYSQKGKDYIINLIDTPGHVDFGGDVTRAMRAVDGVVLVVDPVEGIMPQTETVLRQAMKEMEKPVLFVNKVDRLLNELRLTPEQTQQRLAELINNINKLIEDYAPEQFAQKWKVSVENGSVCFGSAMKRWAVSIDIMKEKKVSFKDVFAYTAAGNEAKLEEIAPVEETILPMIVKHLPSPKEAQQYRVPHMWHGELTTGDGKAMMETDASAKTNMVVFKVLYDPHSGEVAVCRVFSGVAKKGLEINVSGRQAKQRVQQVGLYMGPDKVIVDQIPAGNIAGLIGLKDPMVGDTLSENEIEPFEQITHYSKPVVTKAIEPKDPKDTTKLIEALRLMQKEDPTITVEINQETGEHLLSGMGELHLEIKETKLKDDFKIPIITSEPIVVYTETIETQTKDIVGKSPNKHSRFTINIEPVPEGIQKAIDEGHLSDGKPKGQFAIETFIKGGLDRQTAKGVVQIYGKNLLVDATHGVQYLNEVMELLIEGFKEALKDGPLAREKCSGIMVSITDATIHEDPVHRGPAQIIPAIRNAIYGALLINGIVLLEPKQNFMINIPQDTLSNVISFLQNRRGQITNVNQDREQVSITAKLPVSEVIKGFSNELRSLTQGRAIWYPEFAGYEKMPKELQAKIVHEIRTRKGQPPEPPKPEQFLD
jgi:elongation factor 2